MTLTAVLLPLFSALLLLIVPGALQRAIVVISGVFTFLTALALPQVGAFEAPWIEPFGLYFSLSPAGAGSVLVMTAALVMLPTALYASFVVKERTGGFLTLLLAMQAAINGLFLAQDLVLFYVFWEGALVASVLMLGIWGW